MRRGYAPPTSNDRARGVQTSGSVACVPALLPRSLDVTLKLQRLAGNNAVERWLTGTLQRQPGPAAVSAPPATQGRVVTDYGTFQVYPDDFIGPLPVGNRTSGPWSVRQAELATIQTAVASIRSGVAGLKVIGTPAYKSAVVMDLAWLMTQSVGRELVQSLVGTGKSLTIQETTGGNVTSYTPDTDSWEVPAPGGIGPPSPGIGSNVTIGYNNGEWNPYGGVETWMRRPPAIGLAHEMVHAWTGMSGIRAKGDTAGVRRRELQATGLGEFAQVHLTENRFRAAFALPERPRY